MQTMKAKTWDFLESIVTSFNKHANYITAPTQKEIELVDIQHVSNVGKISIQGNLSPLELAFVHYDFQDSYVSFRFQIDGKFMRPEVSRNECIVQYNNEADWLKFEKIFEHFIDYSSRKHISEAFLKNISEESNRNLDSLTELFQDYCSMMGLTQMSADELIAEIVETKPLYAEEVKKFLEIWEDVEDNLSQQSGMKM